MADAQEKSHLLEASPSSLDELFSRDPLTLTRQNRDAIVAELRRMRVQWEAAEAAGKTKAPKAVKAADHAAVAATLSELGLDD